MQAHHGSAAWNSRPLHAFGVHAVEQRCVAASLRPAGRGSICTHTRMSRIEYSVVCPLSPTAANPASQPHQDPLLLLRCSCSGCGRVRA